MKNLQLLNSKYLNDTTILGNTFLKAFIYNALYM